ncbi:MAG: tRNA (5-methylaminomethyl-2-thiouridine)(34)-methyltransferase MnmD [Bacteroidetes bacterium]|nr:tRNA (5-methylaminomethyl-2-thiouridine)(34)-methyltransferase MnmD [Bacteroidota bacterium]
MTILLTPTADGSPTLYSETYGEHYHSSHGAIQESEHIFIKAGLQQVADKKNINILEVGFGTGLNALLTFRESLLKGLKINYVGIETVLLDESIYTQLNYAALLRQDELQPVFIRMHEVPANIPRYISEVFILQKLNARLEDVVLADASYDLVYFDAFSPAIQPELWEEAIFHKLYKAMKPNSILTTYSAKGSVKRALLAAGFKVELLDGPVGKRHIIRASKNYEL